MSLTHITLKQGQSGHHHVRIDIETDCLKTVSNEAVTYIRLSGVLPDGSAAHEICEKLTKIFLSLAKEKGESKWLVDMQALSYRFGNSPLSFITLLLAKEAVLLSDHHTFSAWGNLMTFYYGREKKSGAPWWAEQFFSTWTEGEVRLSLTHESAVHPLILRLTDHGNLPERAHPSKRSHVLEPL